METVGNGVGKLFQITHQLLLSSMEEKAISWFGAVGLEWSRDVSGGSGILDANQFCSILEEGLVESFEKLGMDEDEKIFQQDIDPNTHQRRPKDSYWTTLLHFWTGLPNPLTSVH